MLQNFGKKLIITARLRSLSWGGRAQAQLGISSTPIQSIYISEYNECMGMIKQSWLTKVYVDKVMNAACALL